ncbi:hypothetical protein LCGC14_0991030 [marine sediment metagenome]|uniref:Uncharacterized protein n=1 Tax=marine sediment metagenome TaxID=412755 RepID=A0A0F9NAE0_9ZZZZ
MKTDPKSTMTMVEGLSALSRGASTYLSAAVDHALAPAASYFITCGTWASSFVSTLTWSDTAGSGYIDEVAGAGNDLTLTFTEADSGLIHVPNPRGRYTRISTVIGGTCVFSISNISGRVRAYDQG